MSLHARNGKCSRLMKFASCDLPCPHFSSIACATARFSWANSGAFCAVVSNSRFSEKRGSPPGTTGRGVNSTGNDRTPIGVLRLSAIVGSSLVETHQLAAGIDALRTVLAAVCRAVRLTNVSTAGAHLGCRHAFCVLCGQHGAHSIQARITAA